MKPIDAKKYIREKVPQAHLLYQLAEEAAELTHASLKLARVLEGISPTPVTEEEATEKFIEEFNDVLLVSSVAGCFQDFDIQANKLTRWYSRLKEAEKDE